MTKSILATVFPSNLGDQINYDSSTGQNQTAYFAPNLPVGTQDQTANSSSNLSANPDWTYQYGGIGAASMDISPATRNSWNAMGFYLFWPTDDFYLAAAVMAVSLAVLALYSPEFGFVYALIGIVLGTVLPEVSSFVCSGMAPYNLNVLYFLVGSYMLFGWFPIPLYFETGFYANHVDLGIYPIWSGPGGQDCYFDVWDTNLGWIPQFLVPSRRYPHRSISCRFAENLGSAICSVSI